MHHQQAQKRGPNIKPTREFIRQCYTTLQQAVNRGDVHAAGWLIHLDMLERQQTIVKQGG